MTAVDAMMRAVAVQSYLPERSGGVVVAATFADDDAAQAAVDLLHQSGVRLEDISVIARDRTRAEAAAGGRAWTPWRGRERASGPFGALLRAMPARLPREIRRRHGSAIAAGHIVIVVVAGGQPPDTLHALFERSRGESIAEWWSKPLDIFAPPELAGPF